MYSAGMLDSRVTILTKSAATAGKFGKGSGAQEWTETTTIWAAVDWSRGSKALREGAIDAYDSIMIRCRYNTAIDRQCRIKYDDRIWKIDSFHADSRDNTIQMTCTELVNNNNKI